MNKLRRTCVQGGRTTNSSTYDRRLAAGSCKAISHSAVPTSFTIEKIFKLNTTVSPQNEFRPQRSFCSDEDMALGPWLWTSWDAFHLYLVAQSLFHYLAQDTKSLEKVTRERRLVVTQSAPVRALFSESSGSHRIHKTTPRTDQHLPPSRTPTVLCFHARVL